MSDATEWRERVATILEIIARDRLPNPHDLDVALDAIECETADEIKRLREARNLAIKEVADMARQAGSWRGIAEGKDIVIQQLEAERERLKAIVNWLNPQGLAVGPITNTKEMRHEADQ
jgi:hypothetical protein